MSVADAPLLQLLSVTCTFGGIVALDKVSFSIPHGVICGLIGPNGAGKTTLFNCLSRIYTPTAGSMILDGIELGELPPFRMASLGIGRTFQNLALFPTMSVYSNVLTGAHHLLRSTFLSDSLKLPFVRREESAIRQKVSELIGFLNLDSVRDIPVSELPFGTRKRVELARALASQPKLLLLDEPAGGLNHQELDELRSLIMSIRSQFRLTILLVEHHMNLVMRISDKVIALDFGQKIAEGTPEEVRNNEQVISAYLGTGR